MKNSLALEIDKDLMINIYDPNTKELVITYESRSKAADRLGITKNVMTHAILEKRKFYSPNLNKELCAREKRKTPDMIFKHGILWTPKK